MGARWGWLLQVIEVADADQISGQPRLSVLDKRSSSHGMVICDRLSCSEEATPSHPLTHPLTREASEG